jgi:anti-sigma B factor antagonist
MWEKKKMKRNEDGSVNRIQGGVMLKVHAKNLGNVTVLSLKGQIVSGETEVLRTAVQSLSGISAVKLDLARVSTIDAAGLGTMLELREQAESKSIQFDLMNVNKRIRRVFEITRLDTVFRITPKLRFFPVSHRRRVRPLASCA